MLDLKNLRDNFDDIKKMLSSRGYKLDEDRFKLLDEERKVFQITVENLQADKKPEFHNWKWVSPQEVLNKIVVFKKEIYQKILKEFKCI